MSHPTWVRGLKLDPYRGTKYENESHPTWVRGLKLMGANTIDGYLCRTLRGCVD